MLKYLFVVITLVMSFAGTAAPAPFELPSAMSAEQLQAFR